VASGWWAIRLKRVKRTQRRRAEVYVDVLAWVGARTRQWLDPPPGADAAQLPEPPEDRKTDPHKVATNLMTRETDPGSPFFVALRARLVAFGSHDMTRAFDDWVVAYRQLSGSDENLRKLKPTKYRRLFGEHPLRFMAARPIESWKRLRDPGRPDEEDGCLTRAIERCASAELRKG
jgi:hypothetical protein